MGTTEDNIAIVKRSYTQFASGDMEGLVNNYDDSLATWDMAGETPWVGPLRGSRGHLGVPRQVRRGHRSDGVRAQSVHRRG